MSALYKSIALLLTINACLINNNIIASELNNKDIISSNVNIINNKTLNKHDLSFNINNINNIKTNSNNENTINQLSQNKKQDNINDNKIMKEDEKIIDYNNPVLIENNKKLLNEVAENIDNNNLDEAKNKLEEFLKNIPQVEMNYIDKEIFTNLLINAAEILNDEQYNHTSKDRNDIKQKINNVKTEENTIKVKYADNKNLLSQKLNDHLKQQCTLQKKLNQLNAAAYKEVEQTKQLLIKSLNKNKLIYKFEQNRYKNNNAEHLLIDKNHIFYNIGFTEEYKSKGAVINGITNQVYYNELQKITNKLYDRKNNNIQNELQDKLYEAVNYTLINPIVNKSLKNINNNPKNCICTFNENNNKTSSALSIIDNITQNKLILEIKSDDNNITANFGTFFGMCYPDYLRQKKQYDKYVTCYKK